MDNHCTCTNVNRCPHAFETHTDKLICQKPKEESRSKQLTKRIYNIHKAALEARNEMK
jgi:hypothetical protein